MIKSLYTEITSKIRCLLGGNYMKKGFLSALLTLFMVLMMLPTTAYAGKAYCGTCGKWVGTISTYEYKDGGYHWEHVSCAECGTHLSDPRKKHNWSGTATCTSGQTCTVCGGTSNPLGHAWSSNWISDENNHWHKCNACAETTDVGEHIWNSGVITTSPTCTTAGEKTYTCSACERKKTEVISATGHDLKAIEKKEASCTEDGYEAYWRCQTCGKIFSDEAGTAEIGNPTAIKATGHNLEKVEKKDAGCTEDGYETYWKCNTCKKLFSDEAGTVEISNPTEIKATGHNLEKVEKKDATATEEGNSTYWFCDKCNKYFSDAKAETEIKKEDTVLAKLSTVNKKETEASSAKTANATKVTSTTDKTTKSSPKTGDSTDVQLYVILMLVSIGAAAGAGAKRKLKTQR